MACYNYYWLLLHYLERKWGAESTSQLFILLLAAAGRITKALVKAGVISNLPNLNSLLTDFGCSTISSRGLLSAMAPNEVCVSGYTQNYIPINL